MSEVVRDEQPEHCAYCELEATHWCDILGCEAPVCLKHGHRDYPHTGLIEVLCNPDPATHPGRGCYRPPLSEVRDDRDERR